MDPSVAGSSRYPGGGGDGGGLPPVGAAPVQPSSCTICLEPVGTGARRSVVKLLCGHDFHLDCIGSAFNAKGQMQCPNCRQVEEGNWRCCASGSFSLPDLNVNDSIHDEDFHDTDLSDLELEVRWCPLSRLEQILASIDEMDSSPTDADQEILGLLAVSFNHPASPSSVDSHASDSQHIQPPYSSYSQVPSEILQNGPPYHNQWSHFSQPTDAHTSQAFPYTSANIHSHVTDQTPLSSLTRTARFGSHGPPRVDSIVHTSNIRNGPGSVNAGYPHAFAGYPHNSSHMYYENQLNYPQVSGFPSGPRQIGGSPSSAPRVVVGTGQSPFYPWHRDHRPPSQQTPVNRDHRPPSQQTPVNRNTTPWGHHPQMYSRRRNSESSSGQEALEEPSSPHTHDMHQFI